MTLLPDALRALWRGFTIFPVEPNEKTPHRSNPHRSKEDAPWTIKWSEVATTDLNRICSWWRESPNANIGIAAKPSGLLIVDCDMPKREYQLKDTAWEFLHEKHGPLVDGNDVLREMCARYGDNYGRLERTYRVCTASMGLHLYFRWPEMVEASQASPVPGLLDVRCNGGTKGGYVLGAGSQTAKGPYVAENDLPVADAPPWLIELVREKPRPARPKSVFSQPRQVGNFSGLVEAVAYAQEGNRNNALLWAARAMCEDGATEEDAIELLVPPALDCGLDGGERQAEQTIRSGFRLQQRKTG
ncbi:bifunctional DNA primase/polymerase [Streptomyces microflavus]|uniref:bifunctional DNA primase/polymerase n=1 Tax=Streptomyces microflavus TaxID=1919 RepID=UPI0036946A24